MGSWNAKPCCLFSSPCLFLPFLGHTTHTRTGPHLLLLRPAILDQFRGNPFFLALFDPSSVGYHHHNLQLRDSVRGKTIHRQNHVRTNFFHPTVCVAPCSGTPHTLGVLRPESRTRQSVFLSVYSTTKTSSTTTRTTGSSSTRSLDQGTVTNRTEQKELELSSRFFPPFRVRTRTHSLKMAFPSFFFLPTSCCYKVQVATDFPPVVGAQGSERAHC